MDDLNKNMFCNFFCLEIWGHAENIHGCSCGGQGLTMLMRNNKKMVQICIQYFNFKSVLQ